MHDVTFSARPGETYGLLGPNGGGRTTTIGMVSCLLRCDNGDVTVGGHPMEGAGSRQTRALIGYVPQDVALYPDLSVRENFRFFGQLYGLGVRELAARVDEVLVLVGLRDRGEDRVPSFSGGAGHPTTSRANGWRATVSSCCASRTALHAIPVRRG